MKFEFSAGGIVYKPIRQAQGKKSIEILVAQHSQHHGWVFPKGLIEKNQETKEDAALREVGEETGVVGRIIKPLAPVTYFYVFKKAHSAGSGQVKIRKTVYYFLMEYVSGDISKHDMEMENVEWLPVEETESRLTYKSDKQVWSQARALLNK